MKAPGDVTVYFEYITSLLALCRIVEPQEIRIQKRTSSEGYLRGDVVFNDSSRLHFRELVSTDPKIQLVSYSYQYMRAGGTLVFRYDDSDHFRHLPTAPHHKHLGENDVITANAPNLESVLREIEGMLKT